MTSISVYDDTAKDIEKICSDNDMSDAELIDCLMGLIDVVKENNDLI